MNAIDKWGEFAKPGSQKSEPGRSDPLGRQEIRKSRLFVLVADDEHAISRIKELASICIEIDCPASQSDPDGLPLSGAPIDTALRDILTPRRFDIALGVARGLSNKDIGRELGISHFTVRNHLSQVLLVLGLSSRQQLADLLRRRLLRLA